jgi:hypothetical protein
MVNEFSLFQYLLQVAPALGISVWALFKVWARLTAEQDSRARVRTGESGIPPRKRQRKFTADD